LPSVKSEKKPQLHEIGENMLAGSSSLTHTTEITLVEMITGQGKPKYSEEENPAPMSLYPTHATYTALGLNPSL
jgi:hypothetical protein